MKQGDIGRRRIIITLDTGEVDAVEFERWGRLARRLDAELEGVFIEDSDLFRLAGLTFLQELRPTSLKAERFHLERLQQELRAVARRAERSLAACAKQLDIPWRFRIWRGSLESELLAALEADVLALTGLGAIRPRSTRRRSQGMITACFDGSKGAARALATAADIAADAEPVSLQVLLVPVPEIPPHELRRRADEMLSDDSTNAVYKSLTEAGPRELAQVLRDSGSSALVMQRDNPLLVNTSLREYLAHLHCTLLLVR